VGYWFRSISFFVCIFVSLYLCIFVSLSARLRENGWTDLHEEKKKKKKKFYFAKQNITKKNYSNST